MAPGLNVGGEGLGTEDLRKKKQKTKNIYDPLICCFFPLEAQMSDVSLLSLWSAEMELKRLLLLAGQKKMDFLPSVGPVPQ